MIHEHSKNIPDTSNRSIRIGQSFFVYSSDFSTDEIYETYQSIGGSMSLHRTRLPDGKAVVMYDLGHRPQIQLSNTILSTNLRMVNQTPKGLTMVQMAEYDNISGALVQSRTKVSQNDHEIEITIQEQRQGAAWQHRIRQTENTHVAQLKVNGNTDAQAGFDLLAWSVIRLGDTNVQTYVTSNIACTSVNITLPYESDYVMPTIPLSIPPNSKEWLVDTSLGCELPWAQNVTYFSASTILYQTKKPPLF